MLDIIYHWNSHNLYVIYFIYGLSFVIMGVGVLVQPKKESRFELASILWLFAFYALIHAPADFIDARNIIEGRNETVHHIGQILTYVAYIFLFEFSRRLMRLNKKNIGGWVLPVLIITVIIASILSDNFWTTSNVLIGYFVRFPAGIMGAGGLILYYLREKKQFRPLILREFPTCEGGGESGVPRPAGL